MSADDAEPVRDLIEEGASDLVVIRSRLQSSGGALATSTRTPQSGRRMRRCLVGASHETPKRPIWEVGGARPEVAIRKAVIRRRVLSFLAAPPGSGWPAPRCSLRSLTLSRITARIRLLQLLRLNDSALVASDEHALWPALTAGCSHSTPLAGPFGC